MEENSTLLYCPCRLFEKIVNVVLKCLGYDHHHHHHQPSAQTDSSASASSSSSSSSPEAEEEIGMKTSEEVGIMQSTRAVSVSRRRPRPPVSSGGGGQIN
ncbi:hypothetical protein ACFE04_017523 [Oxalis oulophora]